MAGRLAGSLGLCLALLLTGPSGAMQWGVNGHPFTAYPGVDYGEQIALVAGMGATSYRVNVSHADQAPYLARLVEAAKAQGVVILPVLTPGVDLEGEDPDTTYEPTKEWVSLPLGPTMGASQLLDSDGAVRILGAEQTAEIKGTDLMVSVIRSQLNLP